MLGLSDQVQGERTSVGLKERYGRIKVIHVLRVDNPCGLVNVERENCNCSLPFCATGVCVCSNAHTPTHIQTHSAALYSHVPLCNGLAAKQTRVAVLAGASWSA
jgi:hypothetical protein